MKKGGKRELMITRIIIQAVPKSCYNSSLWIFTCFFKQTSPIVPADWSIWQAVAAVARGGKCSSKALQSTKKCHNRVTETAMETHYHLSEVFNFLLLKLLLCIILFYSISSYYKSKYTFIIYNG